MPENVKPGQTVRVTISKTINRAAARKTLERLFMQDKTVRAPLDKRAANFVAIPKRRGGQIWTKLANKLHPNLNRGAAATIRATPQSMRDLKSVSTFVDVTSA